jgi:hypothetical protein
VPKPGAGLPVPRPEAKSGRPAASPGQGLIDPFGGRIQAKAVSIAPSGPAAPEQKFALGASLRIQLADADSSTGAGLDARSMGIRLGRLMTLRQLLPRKTEAAPTESKGKLFQFVGSESAGASATPPRGPGTDKFSAAPGVKGLSSAGWSKNVKTPAAPGPGGVRQLQISKPAHTRTSARADEDPGEATLPDASARTQAMEVPQELLAQLKKEQASSASGSTKPAAGRAGEKLGGTLSGGAPAPKAPPRAGQPDLPKKPRTS